MSKGDHVFNNIVKKLKSSFEEGLREYFKEAKKGRSDAERARLQRASYAELMSWMQHHLPRTWQTLHGFETDPELVHRREKLQTANFEGGDLNTAIYSEHAQQFDDAVLAFFRKLATTGSYLDENTLLPNIASIRRAFDKMAQVAVDPDALRRLLAERQHDPREKQRIEAEVEQVRESLRWAWGRCERLFRMTTNELLRL